MRAQGIWVCGVYAILGDHLNVFVMLLVYAVVTVYVK